MSANAAGSNVRPATHKVKPHECLVGVDSIRSHMTPPLGRMVVLPALIGHSAGGGEEEGRRYLAYSSADKVTHVLNIY